jgi:hypothetical protein
VDSESLAAAGLLEALSRAAKILAELHHPFVRNQAFSFFLPPAGVRTGTAFTLPDGREVHFTLTVTASRNAFHIEGAVTVEGDLLLGLPRKSTPSIHDGLVALDDYAGELAAPAARLIDQLLDGLV